MEIRELRAGDGKSLSLLAASVYDELPESMNLPERPDGPAADAIIEMKLESAGRGALFDLVAVEDGEVIGDCEILRRGAEGVVGILVSKDWRRKGVGGTLLEKCIGKARRAGLSEVTAEVAESNAPAMAFFRKQGFSIEGAASEKGTILMRRSLL
jgi:ribosomal protein S18 acetylase RimI-like enzyme